MRGEEKNENKKGRWNGGGEMKWTLSFGKLRGEKKGRHSFKNRGDWN